MLDEFLADVEPAPHGTPPTVTAHNAAASHAPFPHHAAPSLGEDHPVVYPPAEEAPAAPAAAWGAPPITAPSPPPAAPEAAPGPSEAREMLQLIRERGHRAYCTIRISTRPDLLCSAMQLADWGDVSSEPSTRDARLLVGKASFMMRTIHAQTVFDAMCNGIARSRGRHLGECVAQAAWWLRLNLMAEDALPWMRRVLCTAVHCEMWVAFLEASPMDLHYVRAAVAAMPRE